VVDRLRRDEAGFGLMELLIALVVLNIGILATIAALNSGAFALQRASKLSTASALADAQMELFRALRYDAIGLHDVATADGDATYRDDPARGYPGSTMVAVASCAGTTFPVECKPIQSVSGAASPDGREYRVDTFVVEQSQSAASRPVKVVTVVVRDGTDLSKALVRAQSTFDLSTGI
jgi:Tfp pilus assembly protein PilV